MPRKKQQNTTPLQTKIVQKVFLLKNCCLCHNDECYQFIPVFPCVDNVKLYKACGCKINCVLPVLKRRGWGEITCTLWIKQKVSWLWHALRHYITTQPFLLTLHWYRRVSGMHCSRYCKAAPTPYKVTALIMLKFVLWIALVRDKPAFCRTELLQ